MTALHKFANYKRNMGGYLNVDEERSWTRPDHQRLPKTISQLHQYEYLLHHAVAEKYLTAYTDRAFSLERTLRSVCTVKYSNENVPDGSTYLVMVRAGDFDLCGTVHMTNKKLDPTNNRMVYLICNDSINPLFLYYYLRENHNNICMHATMVKVDNKPYLYFGYLLSEDIYSGYVYVPSVSDQNNFVRHMQYLDLLKNEMNREAAASGKPAYEIDSDYSGNKNYVSDVDVSDAENANDTDYVSDTEDVSDANDES